MPDEEEVIWLALCEASFLFLKPDVLYKFEVREGCEDCKRLAELARNQQLTNSILDAILLNMDGTVEKNAGIARVRQMLTLDRAITEFIEANVSEIVLAEDFKHQEGFDTVKFEAEVLAEITRRKAQEAFSQQILDVADGKITQSEFFAADKAKKLKEKA